MQSSLALLVWLSTLAAPAAPWHLNGWQERAIVEIGEPVTDAGVDTAAVKILCQGRTDPEGKDYRVLDESGMPVPFQLTWHDPAHYSWVAFRASSAKKGQRFYIYYGNPQAERAAEQVVTSAAPGAGPPQGAWVPKYGLVYATIERPRPPADSKKDDNPQTEEELAKMLASSPFKHGARYQRGISDGYNPFGASDYYMSVYRGWINIPTAGKYQFCTASNEASFSFLDGKPLVHWPGRHTADRGLRGEKNALVELTAGLHYIEYYHEEVTLQQVAFLGWRPSGEPGEFSGIPESIYTQPHPAAVVNFDSPTGSVPRFEPLIVDSVWPIERHLAQYTRVKFQASSASQFPEGTVFRWEFGDTQSAVGNEVQHVYLTPGMHEVSLTVESPAGKGTVKWPLNIYEIQHATDTITDGKPVDYVPIVRTYDRTKLDAPRFRELAWLFNEARDFAESLKAGNEFVERFGASLPDDVSRMRRLMAENALELGQGGVKEAIANYMASLTDKTPPAERLDVMARLIRLLGVERESPDEAAQIIEQINSTVKSASLDEASQAAYRRALIASGDVALWNGEPGKAQEIYKKAEVLSGQFIPTNVRSARLGAYPNSIREYLLDGNHGAALDLVNRWDETFPTDKIHGNTFFWRGKLVHIRGDHRQAARLLARAIGLAVGAEWEAESRWLLAGSLEEIGRPDAAQRELAKLAKLGVKDPYVEKAQEKLQTLKLKKNK